MKKSQIALLLVCAYCLAPVFGAAQKKVGSSCSSGWESNEYNTTYKRQTYDFSSCINQPGNYTITFAYKSGSHLLASRNAVIEVDGKKVASFDKEVSAGLNPSKWSYTFNVQSKPKKVTLAVDLRTDGGSNSSGTIKVVRNGSANSEAAKLDGDYNFFAKKSSGSSSSNTRSSGSSSSSTSSTNADVAQILKWEPKAKGIWEQKTAPVKIPNELIIYNKNSSLSRKPQRTEVVKFKDRPKVAEYTTGDITRPERYIEYEAYPVNEEAKRENKAATRNDRIEKATLYIADGTTTVYKNAYRGRTDIAKIVLPTSLITIGDYAFADMPNLVSVEKEGSENLKVEYVGDHAFDQDVRLRKIPWLIRLKYLGVCSFRETGLEDAYNLRTYFIGDSAFMGSALKKVGWFSIKAIGDYAFKDCKNLTEWKFDGVYLDYVGHGAFLGTPLAEATLPEGVMVGMEAFEPNTEITWELKTAKSEEKVHPKRSLDYYIDVMPEVNDFTVLMPEDYDPVTDVDVPLILYLHGRSMCKDLPSAHEYGPLKSMEQGFKILENEKAIVVSPNAISKEGWSTAKLHKLYEFLKAHYAFDHNRFYVVGLSMGGWGTMNYANRYPDEVAACIAFCGGCDATKPCGLNQVPTWIVHAKDDEMTSVSCSDRVVKAMKECGSTNLLKYSRLEQGGHSLIYYFDYYNLYDWLLSHNRKNRTFNHNIDFIANPQMAVDEDCYTLGVKYYDFYYQEVTPEVLSKIKQRTPNAQGTPVPPKVKPAEAPVKVEPVTRIPTGPKKGKR